MIQEPFSTGTSVMHKTDPRVRIVSAAVLSFTIALSDHYATLGCGFALAFSAVLFSEIKFSLVLKRLYSLFWFLLLLWIVLPFTYEGDIIYPMGMFSPSYQGTALCLKISIKSLSILLLFISLISTMPVSTMGHALHALHVPSKLVHLLLLTYRYIFVLEQEYQKLLRALKIRGFVPGTNLHSYKTYAYLAGMLFVRASVRADHVCKAMKCRGFQGRFYTLDIFSPGQKDLFFGLASVITAAGLVWMEWSFI